MSANTTNTRERERERELSFKPTKIIEKQSAFCFIYAQKIGCIKVQPVFCVF